MRGAWQDSIPYFCSSFEHTVVLESREAGESEHDEGGEQKGGNWDKDASDSGEG